MAVQLWMCELDRMLTDEEQAALLQRLPADRRERLLSIPCQDRWREPLCAYALLRLAVQCRYGWPELPDMALTERGKPFFSKHRDCHFSISHTDGGVLVGLSETPVGVDLERLRPVSPRVRRRLELSGQMEQTYFQNWTLHEAAVKREGSDAAMLRDTAYTEGAEPIVVPPGFAGAAAGKGPIMETSIVSMEELLAF